MSLISSVLAFFGATPSSRAPSLPAARTPTPEEIIDRGWRSAMHAPWGMRADKVWLWRAEWSYPALYEANSIPPQMNVHGLWWKPWRPSDDEVPK